MNRKHIPQHIIILSVVLSLGLLSTANPLLAQGPDREHQRLESRLKVKVHWLILDPASPADQVLPPLLEVLTVLKARGEVIDFDQTPHSSAPTAVSGLRVMAPPDAVAVLRGLPGVLDVGERLPPPPPAPGEIVALGTTATITGRVTAAGTGTPLDFISVLIYDAVSYTWLDSAITGTDGYYTTVVTAPFSRVKIRFEDDWSWAPVYASEWYNNKLYFSTADAITLPAGGTVPNLNAALEKLGTIDGTLTFDGSGLPVAGIWVRAYHPDGTTDWSWGNHSDWTGHYDLSVPPGIYKLRFSGEPIVEEWYQNKGSQSTANSVTVAAGQTKTIDASVAVAGRITGSVTDQVTGLPLMDVWVSAFDTWGNLIDLDLTDLDGDYEIGGLGTGSYKIRFQRESYGTEYYNNQPALAQATPVGVTAGQTTSNINAALAPLPSAISGMITKDGGTPLYIGEDVYIDLYDAASGDWIDYYYFEGEGDTPEYSFRVWPGTYKVLFDSIEPGLRIEWYNNRTTQATADLVTVTAGQTATGISADLTTATGCIAGTVTAAEDSSKIPDVDIDVFYTQEWSWYAQTDGNGEYQLCGLAGDFLVRFSHDLYQVEWYNNRLSQMTADTVVVANGATTTDINAALSLGGCILGRVIDMNGLFRPEAWVDLYDATGNFVKWVSPEFDASFVFCGLPTGSYVIVCGEGILEGSIAASATVGQGTSNVICQLGPPTYTYTYLPFILKNSH